MNEKLEKLNRQKTAAEKKLIAAPWGANKSSVSLSLLVQYLYRQLQRIAFAFFRIF